MEAEALVEGHRHHLGAEIDHPGQEGDLAALLGEALAQHVLALGILGEVIELGLVGRTQVMEERRGFHEESTFLK
ncbi:hypothetical protein [Acidovorax oryzae]|uniref:hypothetical protein n=1 Tax=Paracidovorax oryzae TaxID=862720 RepID=UPI00178C61E0